MLSMTVYNSPAAEVSFVSSDISILCWTSKKHGAITTLQRAILVASPTRGHRAFRRGYKPPGRCAAYFRRQSLVPTSRDTSALLVLRLVLVVIFDHILQKSLAKDPKTRLAPSLHGATRFSSPASSDIMPGCTAESPLWCSVAVLETQKLVCWCAVCSRRQREPLSWKVSLLLSLQFPDCLLCTIMQTLGSRLAAMKSSDQLGQMQCTSSEPRSKRNRLLSCSCRRRTRHFFEAMPKIAKHHDQSSHNAVAERSRLTASTLL